MFRALAFTVSVLGVRLGLWLILVWLILVFLAVHVNKWWLFAFAWPPLLIFPLMTVFAFCQPEETPEQEKERLARYERDARERDEWYRRARMGSSEYREEQIGTALYERAKTGDIEAMKVYLDHQQWRASHPQRRIGGYGEADMPWG